MPLLVRVQRLARYVDTNSETDLLTAHIQAEFTGEAKDMLLQAYALHALVVIIDGIDEAAALKFK